MCVQRGPASVGPSRFTHCPTCQTRNQCCASCRPSRWTNSRPRRQKSVILERHVPLGRRGVDSMYTLFYIRIIALSARCTSHRRLWLAVQDLQGEQTRNRRSRRRCDFAVPDRTPASGCAEGSSQLVCKSVNRQMLLISFSDGFQFVQSPIRMPNVRLPDYLFLTLPGAMSLPRVSQPKINCQGISLLCASTMIYFWYFAFYNVFHKSKSIWKDRYPSIYTQHIL